MQVAYAQLKEGSPAVTAAIADARSARNLLAREAKAKASDKAEEIEAERHRRKRRRKDQEELHALLNHRVRVTVAEKEKPRIGRGTARKLFQRASGLLAGNVGAGSARGPDGLYSIHFAFRPRGFASTKGRRWRAGEAERAARYVTREDGLEGGEHGWWSNMAADRTELVGFFRTLEALEKHDRSNANVYISEIIALPAELTPRQRRKAVRRICRFFELRGLGYVVALHLPDSAGDQRNFHCHILYSLRPCERYGAYDWSFAAAKADDINMPAGIAARRRVIVRDINATLHAARVDKRYTHLSNKARRMAAPEPNIGQVGTWIERRLAAMAARQALLQKARSFAAHMRATLIEASAMLAELSAVCEHRRAEAGRRSELAGDAQARLLANVARLESARRHLRQRLMLQRSLAEAGRARATAILAQRASRVAGHLLSTRRAIEQTARIAATRISRVERRAHLQEMLGVARAAVGRGSARLPAITHAVGDRLRQIVNVIGTASSSGTTLLARVTAQTLGLLSARRDMVAQSLGQTGRRLARAGERVRAIESLDGKRRALTPTGNDRERRTLVRLPAVRRIAIARLKAISSAVGGAEQRLGQLDARRARAQERLSQIQCTVASRAAEIDAAVAAAKERGRHLVSGGLGRGPQSQRNVPSVAPPAPTTTSPEPVMAPPVPVAAAATAPSSQSEDDVHERLRRLVRTRKPDEAHELYPPPGERSPASPDAQLLAAERLEMLRAEVRRREKPVRDALRARAIERLKRLDIPVSLDADGNYTVAKNILLDEEMRVLADPSLHDDTQAFLAGIARRQQQALHASAQVPEAQGRPTAADEPGLDLQTLAAAAARRNSKGIGD